MISGSCKGFFFRNSFIFHVGNLRKCLLANVLIFVFFLYNLTGVHLFDQFVEFLFVSFFIVRLMLLLANSQKRFNSFENIFFLFYLKLFDLFSGTFTYVESLNKRRISPNVKFNRKYNDLSTNMSCVRRNYLETFSVKSGESERIFLYLFNVLANNWKTDQISWHSLQIIIQMCHLATT